MASAIITVSAQAQECRQAVHEAIGKRLRVPGLASGELIDAEACKRDPQDPRLTLVALAWNNGQEAQYRKGFVVAEVDEAAGDVVALTARDITVDSVMPLDGGDLNIDAAPYRLAPGVRAFGVDLHQHVPSCADGGAAIERTLYVREGSRLRTVLEHQDLEGGWIVDNSGCGEAQIREHYRVTIGIGPQVHHGWHDLLLTTRFDRSDGKPATRKVEHASSAYDGRYYAATDVRAPWELDKTRANPAGASR